MYTLTDFEHHSSVSDDNEFFTEYLNPELAWRYDSNFFLLKFQPYLQEFKLIEEMQLATHLKENMNHIKFYWPKDTALTKEVTNYLDQQGFLLEYLLLYQINPKDFKVGTLQPTIQVDQVTSESIGGFKSFNYPKDKEEGEDFAYHKLKFYDEIVQEDKFTLLVAKMDQQIVGSLIAIEGKDTFEIDDVYTHEDFRNQSVASHLQKAVMDMAESRNKDVILIADGEDTVKDMYEKQGYQSIGFHIGALKELDS